MNLRGARMALLLVTVSGCGQPHVESGPASPSTSVGSSVAASSVPTEIKRVSAGELQVGEYLPPLDEGRIEIAPPTAWSPMPRDSKYLIRFFKESRNSLPRIEVTVEEDPFSGLTTVTESNLIEFTKAVAANLQAKNTAVIEPPIPMIIGATPCARYVSHLKLKIGEGTVVVERQTLAILHAGRLYHINLLTLPNTLSQSRDAAYAVCAAMRFPEVTTSEPPSAATVE